MTLRAAVFDYGHTFLDFAPAEDRLLEAYAEIRAILVAEAESELPDAAGLIERLSGHVWRAVEESYRRRELDELDIIAVLDEGLHDLGLDLSRELVRQLAEMEHRAMAARLTVPRENLAVLGQLHDMGLKVGLVSNAHFLPELMREDIERLGIAEHVDRAVFSSEIGIRKPHPSIFLHVLNGLGVEPSEAFFVGDRLRDDIEGAKSLGMRGVLTHQYRREELGSYPAEPDLVINALPDIVPWAKSVLADE